MNDGMIIAILFFVVLPLGAAICGIAAILGEGLKRKRDEEKR